LSGSTGWRYIGKPVKRKEDLKVLLAETKYLDDITLPRMAYLGFYRSPYAHAKISSIDLSRVEGTPQFSDVLRAGIFLRESSRCRSLRLLPDA
jgi:CO/xanthine dehydrogenase Mo-binding subunit